MPMIRLIIVGAGGFGREVYCWAQDVQNLQCEWRLWGFIDDNPDALNSYRYPLPIIGSIMGFIPPDDSLLVMAIGTPKVKLGIAQDLESRGGKFITLVHPTARLGASSTLGRGCVICPNVTVTSDARIGNFVTANVSATVGHDARIGDGCTISGHADITGHTLLGTGVFVGSHAVIAPGARVGDFATVGAGSVVLKTVRPEDTVFGIPAKRI